MLPFIKRIAGSKKLMCILSATTCEDRKACYVVSGLKVNVQRSGILKQAKSQKPHCIQKKKTAFMFHWNYRLRVRCLLFFERSRIEILTELFSEIMPC